MSKGYTGASQDQFANDASTVAQLSGGKSAGGMRGIGLIAFVLGQIALNKKQMSLAKDYYNTNKQDYDFFTNTHQTPMAVSAAEAFDPVKNPAYVTDKFVHIPAAAARVAELDRQWLVSRKSLSRYAIGAGQRIDYEYAKNRTQQMAASWFLGWRGEINYAQAHNERRFNRKVMVVNVGVGAGNAVSQGLATAAGNLGAAYGSLGNQFGSLASGLGEEIGVRQGQADTNKTYKQITGH